MRDAGRYRRPQVRGPPVLITAVCAVPEDSLEEDVRRRITALATQLRRGARGRDSEIARHRRTVRPPAAHIRAETFAGDEAEQEIVLGPAEPAGLHVAAEMAAIAHVLPGDEMAVIELHWHDHTGEIDMPPRL